MLSSDISGCNLDDGVKTMVSRGEFTLSATGAAWIMRRSGVARRLRLGPFWEDADVNAAATALLQANHSWANLTALNIMIKKNYNSMELVSVHSMLVWLLGRASKILFLHAELPDLRCLPYLAELKHLQLQLEGSLCDVARCLGSLTNLQTLCIGHDTEFSAPLALHEVRPFFALAGLTQLRSVKLDGVVPGSLTLPQGAELHLLLYTVKDAQQEIWQSLAPALRSVQIRDNCYGGIGNFSQLPRFLLEAPELKSIFLDVETLGTLATPIVLCDAFLRVERLMLKSPELCIRVPAGRLPWRFAKFFASQTLDICFDDPGTFLGSCPAFSFTYQVLRGFGALHLLNGLAERSIKWEFAVVDRGHDSPLLYEFRTLSAVGFTACDPWGNLVCGCGACPSCSARGSCGLDAQFPYITPPSATQ